MQINALNLKLHHNFGYNLGLKLICIISSIQSWKKNHDNFFKNLNWIFNIFLVQAGDMRG